MSRGTLDPAMSTLPSLTGLSPSPAGLPRTVLLESLNHHALTRYMQSEPRGARTPVWALPVSLAATPGIEFSFFSSGYLDVSVHRVPSVWLWIHHTVTEVSSAGFPHSDIHGLSLDKLFDRLSEEERRVDALALRAEERRDKLRKATGSCK